MSASLGSTTENDPTTVAIVGKIQPDVRLAGSISEFSASLAGDKDRHVYFKNLQTRKPPSAIEVVQLTEEINSDGERRHRSWRPYATRLIAILERIRQFAPVGDVLFGGAQNMLASGVWAVVRMSLEISLGFLSYFEKVSAMLLRIGRSVSLHQDFAMLFPQCTQTQVYMCEYTIVMVEICKKIVTHARRPLASQVAASLLSTFDSVFKPLESDLSEWGRMIEKRTAMLVARSTLREQSSNLQRFNRLQVALSREASLRNRQDRKHRLLESLSPDQKDFDAIWRRERKKGTSNWILKHQLYHKWLKCVEPATLWLQGNLGSGKTVTMASIVADLLMADKTTDLKKSQSKRGPRTVSYFFCTSGNRKTLQADSIVGSLVFQALINEALASSFTKSLDTADDTHRHGGSDFYIDILLRATPPEWKGMFVLDGLDELPMQEVEELFAHLKALMQKRHILLCCSSRPISECRAMAASTLGINGTLSMEHVDRSEDIRNYITAEVERWKTIRPFPADLEQLLIKQLDVGSQGMFLWLTLQMEAICPKYTQELHSETEIFSILDNLPRNLPEAFDQALLRIPDQRYASKIFKLVAAADSVMTLDELRVAVNVEPGNLRWDPSSLVGSGFTLASQYGGSLLDIDEEDLCVRFIHHSAFLHLVKPPAIPAAAPFHFEFRDAEVTLGAVCVTYLNYSLFENQVSRAQKVSFSKVPGLVTESVSRPNSLSRRIFSLLSGHRPTFTSKVDLEHLAIELQVYKSKAPCQDDIQLFLPYATNNWLRFTRGFSDNLDNTVYDSWAGLVDGLVSSGSAALPWTAGSPASAAEWAFRNGHGLLFRRQLCNPDPSAVMEVLNTAVRLAKTFSRPALPSRSRSLSPPQFGLYDGQLGLLAPLYLLHKRDEISEADLSLLVGLGCFPFGPRGSFHKLPATASARPILDTIARSEIPKLLQSSSSSNNYVDTAMFLAHYLPTINAVLKNGQTVLHTVIDRGHDKAAWFLLRQKGADPNGGHAPGVPSPLQLSLKQNSEPLGTFLIRLGAGVAANPDNDIPPLFLAIGMHDVHLINRLRKRGAHFPSRQYGRRGETAIQFACRKFCEPGYRDYRYVADHYSSLYTDFIIFNTLLHDGADVNSRNGEGEPPILVATRTGTRGLMRRLLEVGADLAISDTRGATALHGAHGDAMSELLAAGLDLNASSPEGVTPLMVAALHGDWVGVRLLIRARADVNRRIQTHPGAVQLSDSGAKIFTGSRKNVGKSCAERLIQSNTLKEIRNGDTAVSIAISRLKGQTETMKKVEAQEEDEQGGEELQKMAPGKRLTRKQIDMAKRQWRDSGRVVVALLESGRVDEAARQDLLRTTRQHIEQETRQDRRGIRLQYSGMRFWRPIQARLEGRHEEDEFGYLTYKAREESLTPGGGPEEAG